jgi:peptide chain release factor 1
LQDGGESFNIKLCAWRNPGVFSLQNFLGGAQYMLDKLQNLDEKYEELGHMLADPEVLGNPDELRKTAKARADLEDVVMAYREYKQASEELNDAKMMLDDDLDSDMEQMIKEEIKTLAATIDELENKINILLLPKDPNDERNVIVEVRAGTGGDEAALFAADLYKMYVRYAEKQGWKIDVMNSNETDGGGYKEVTFMIIGKGAYSKLKFESGVHRVQRVPATEASGRIHTSAATVAVLPEADDVEVHIEAKDLRIDVFCSSGPGGQSVNTTKSAARVTHIPTGLVVSCQDEKSQQMNKEKAIKVLKSRLYEKMQEEQHGEEAALRRSMIGSGDRSERIRTYNFPQGRITDHRINLTTHRLEQTLMGDLEELIDALVSTDQARKLKQAAEEVEA